MAVLLNGTSQYLSKSPVELVSDEPLTLACWFKTTNAPTGSENFFTVGNTGNGYWGLRILGATAGDPIAALTVDSGNGVVFATSTTGTTAGQWHHAMGVFADSNTRRILLDGGGAATVTGTRVAPTPNYVMIGARQSPTVGLFFDGAVADAAVWNVALTDEESAALASGVSPLRIRPENLVGYWPLYDAGNAPSVVSADILTATATPTQTDHAPVQALWVPKLWVPSGTAANETPAAFDHDATAALTMAGESTATANLDSDAAAAFTASGESTATAEFDADAAAAATFEGALGDVTLSADLDADAAAAFTATGESTATADLDSDAAAVLTLSGESEATADLDADAAATATFSGEDAAGAEEAADLDADAAAALTAEGESTATADLDSDAVALIIASGESVATSTFDSDAAATFTAEGFEATVTTEAAAFDSDAAATFTAASPAIEDNTVITLGARNPWRVNLNQKQKEELADEEFLINFVVDAYYGNYGSNHLA